MKKFSQFSSKGAYLKHQLQKFGFSNIKEMQSSSYITAVKEGKTYCFEIASEGFGCHNAEWLMTPEQIEWKRMVAKAYHYSLIFIHLGDGTKPHAVLFTPRSHDIRA